MQKKRYNYRKQEVLKWRKSPVFCTSGPTGPLRCPNVSVHFNAGQEYTIWAVLEANGIPVAQFDDVLYRG